MNDKSPETSEITYGDMIPSQGLQEVADIMVENGATPEEAADFLLRSMRARQQILEREKVLEAMVRMVEMPEEPSFCEEYRNEIRFELAAALFATKKLTIRAIPSVVDRFKDKYVPVINDQQVLTLSQINDLMSKIEPSPTSYVLRSLDHINSARKRDPTFFLIDNDMEVLRKILFYADSMGVNNRNILCEFGIKNLATLRAVVAEWEERKRDEKLGEIILSNMSLY